MQSYDLIIVGGGLVGAGLAIALEETGWRIALVDARLSSQEDHRLFALNKGSCQFLKKIGCWSALETQATPIHRVHVSRQGRFGSVSLDKNDAGLSELGHVIPARLIEAAVNERLQQLSYVTCYRAAVLKTLEQEEDANVVRCMINMDGAEEIILTAPFVIGADGTHSTVRQQLNIPIETFSYDQSAIVTITTLNRSHDFTAYERFNSHGAIAMLPLANQQCATIWTADNQTINSLLILSDEDFLRTLQQRFGYRLGRLQAVSKRYTFPLQLLKATTMIKGNVFLVGNAAHTLHPIAAQGFNLALYEIAILIEAILKKTKQHDIFTVKELQVVHDLIQKQQAVSIGLSHRLASAFSQSSLLTQMALQLGIIGLDMVSPLKKQLLNRIMGRSNRVPWFLL